MEWSQIVNGFKDFWNQPVPIIGFSVGCCLIFVITIISKTSLGKKLLNKLKSEIALIKAQIESLFKEYREYKESIDSHVKMLEENYESKLQQLKDKNKALENLVFTIGKHTHNKNIKKAIEEYLKENDDGGKDNETTQA